MSRADYLAMCARVGIPPAPSEREWWTAFALFWESFGVLVYWDRRAREYWW